MGRRVDLGGMTVAEGGRTTSRTNFLEVERAPVLVSATSKVKGGRLVSAHGPDHIILGSRESSLRRDEICPILSPSPLSVHFHLASQ